MAMEPTFQSLLSSWSQAAEADPSLDFNKWFQQEGLRHGVPEERLQPQAFDNIDLVPKVPTQGNPWEALWRLKNSNPTLFEPKGDGTITLWNERDAAQRQAIEEAEATQRQAELEAIATAPRQTQAPDYGRVPRSVVDHAVSLGSAMAKMGIATGAHEEARKAAEGYRTVGQQARLAAILRRTPKLPPGS